MNCTGGTEREYFLEAWIAAGRWKESNFWKHALPQGGWKESNFWRHGLLRGDGKRVLFGGMHCNEEMEREYFLEASIAMGGRKESNFWDAWIALECKNEQRYYT